MEFDAIKYGPLGFGLKKKRFWPLPKAAPMLKWSVRDVRECVNGIQIMSYPDHGDACGSKSFMLDITKIIKNVPSPVLDIHRQHFDALAGGSAKEKA
jgi:hypothetical protein